MAAARIRAFLDAREKMTGPIDPEVVYMLWVGDECHELTVSDLECLIGGGDE